MWHVYSRSCDTTLEHVMYSVSQNPQTRPAAIQGIHAPVSPTLAMGMSHTAREGRRLLFPALSTAFPEPRHGGSECPGFPGKPRMGKGR